MSSSTTEEPEKCAIQGNVELFRQVQDNLRTTQGEEKTVPSSKWTLDFPTLALLGEYSQPVYNLRSCFLLTMSLIVSDITLIS